MKLNDKIVLFSHYFAIIKLIYLEQIITIITINHMIRIMTVRNVLIVLMVILVDSTS
jgi:hypothetical protein